MNKSFMYANGSLYVFNEENEKSLIPYTDNFKQRLILENSIESIEYVLENTNENIDLLNDKRFNITNSSIKFGELYIITGAVMPFFLNMFLRLNLDLITIDTVIGKMTKQTYFTIVFAIIGLTMGIVNYTFNIKDLKEILQKLNGLKKINEEMIMRKKIEKDIYSKLLDDNSNECEDELNNDKIKFKKIDINDDYEAKNLQSLINASLYYGMNKNIYIKYYQRKELREKTMEILLPSEIVLIEQFIEEDLEKEKNKKLYKRRKF